MSSLSDAGGLHPVPGGTWIEQKGSGREHPLSLLELGRPLSPARGHRCSWFPALRAQAGMTPPTPPGLQLTDGQEWDFWASVTS